MQLVWDEYHGTVLPRPSMTHHQDRDGTIQLHSNPVWQPGLAIRNPVEPRLRNGGDYEPTAEKWATKACRLSTLVVTPAADRSPAAQIEGLFVAGLATCDSAVSSNSV